MKNFKEDNYNFIFIIHINKNFNKKKERIIYSLLDINDDINQVFIDNLNGNNDIRIHDLLYNNTKIILENYKHSLELDEQFNKILTNYLLVKLQASTSFIDNYPFIDYINEMKDYFKNEVSIRLFFPKIL